MKMIRITTKALATTTNLCKCATILFIAPPLLCGCRTHTEVVPMETHSEVSTHDTTISVKVILLRDSSATHTETATVIKDSIAPIFDSLGRLTGFDRYHNRETTRTTDTNTKRLMGVIDSLQQEKGRVEYLEKPIPYPVEKLVSHSVVKEVDRKRTWCEKTLNALGWTMLAILGAFTLTSLAYLYLKCKKKEIR